MIASEVTRWLRCSRHRGEGRKSKGVGHEHVGPAQPSLAMVSRMAVHAMARLGSPFRPWHAPMNPSVSAPIALLHHHIAITILPRSQPPHLAAVPNLTLLVLSELQ